MSVMGLGTAEALVGRARERDSLIAALAGSRTPSGGIVLIEGEPGIGKSRLLLELAQIAAAERFVVLDARASAPELYRDAVIAVHVLGLSYREAARFLRAREATITTRLHRGRQHVARRLSIATVPG